MAGIGGKVATGEMALLCSVGERLIVLPAGQVPGVRAISPLWRPPTLPPAIAGFLPLGGRALPVLRTARLLGLDERRTIDLYTHIVWVRGLAARTAGLLLDRAEDMIRLDRAAMNPLDPADTLNGCAVATLDLAGRTAHLIDPARLLQAAEQAALGEIAEDADRRIGEWRDAAA